MVIDVVMNKFGPAKISKKLKKKKKKSKENKFSKNIDLYKFMVN